MPLAPGASLPLAPGASLPLAPGASLPLAPGASLPLAPGASLPLAAAPSGFSPSAAPSSPSFASPMTSGAAASASAGAASSSALGTLTVKMISDGSLKTSMPGANLTSLTWTESPIFKAETSTSIFSGSSAGRQRTEISRTTCSRIPPSRTPAASPSRRMGTSAVSFSVREISSKSMWMTASVRWLRWISLTIASRGFFWSATRRERIWFSLIPPISCSRYFRSTLTVKAPPSPPYTMPGICPRRRSRDGRFPPTAVRGAIFSSICAMSLLLRGYALCRCVRELDSRRRRPQSASRPS